MITSLSLSFGGSSSSVYVDISWDGSKWWTMDSTGRIKDSTDGTNWNDVGNDSTNFIQGQGVESNGSTILAYGDPDSLTDVGVQYSTNGGTSWSDSDLTNIRINAVAWNGTRWDWSLSARLWMRCSNKRPWYLRTVGTVSRPPKVVAIGHRGPSRNGGSFV